MPSEYVLGRSPAETLGQPTADSKVKEQSIADVAHPEAGVRVSADVAHPQVDEQKHSTAREGKDKMKMAAITVEGVEAVEDESLPALEDMMCDAERTVRGVQDKGGLRGAEGVWGAEIMQDVATTEASEAVRASELAEAAAVVLAAAAATKLVDAEASNPHPNPKQVEAEAS